VLFRVAGSERRGFARLRAAIETRRKAMKRHWGALAAAAAVLVTVLGVAACSTTQSPGKQVDDASIHAAVKAKLTADRFSNIVNVDINVTNGVVTLAGEVPNAKVKSEAEAEARSVDGVVKVVNNLQIKSPPTS
jgi:osmotically-inducible protein OsmY